MSKPDPTEASSADGADRGYQQIYLIRKSKDRSSAYRNVFFRCGNWCYSGEVSFDFLKEQDAEGTYREIGLKDVPEVIPALQRQQDELSLLGCAECIPPSSGFNGQLELFGEAQDFLSSELSHPQISEKLEEWKEAREWVDDNNSAYFELIGDVPGAFRDVQCLCAKRYVRGLVFVTIYFEGVFYTILQDGGEEQPLLDVKFPDISEEGEGLTLALYDDNDEAGRGLWRKLSLWQLIPGDSELDLGLSPRLVVREPQIADISTDAYMQTYVVLKPDDGMPPNFREVLFRFGSWCYSGTVELVEDLGIVDIPHVIPALRLQQSRLNFLCDASQIPGESSFAAPLQNATNSHAVMECEVASIGKALQSLRGRLGGSAGDWLDDPDQSFFEFTSAQDGDEDPVLENVDLIATKRYSPNGIVTIAIYFDGTHYLSVHDGGEDQPLLDTKFPSIVQGRGYQIRSYPAGVMEWSELRRLVVWQNAESMVEDSKDTPGAKEAETTESSPEAKNDFEEKRGSVPRSHTRSESKEENKAETVSEEKVSSSMPSARDAKTEFHAAEMKGDEMKGAAPPDERKVRSSSKEVAPAKQTYDHKRGSRHNLGAFHHLAPLRSSSKLEGQMKELKESIGPNNGSVPTPWDKKGRPLKAGL